MQIQAQIYLYFSYLNVFGHFSADANTLSRNAKCIFFDINYIKLTDIETEKAVLLFTKQAA